MNIQTKRIYEERSPDDGVRILVDGIWPRGISKEKAYLDEWLKSVAPSKELRQWFNHEEDKFEQFERLYKKELEDNQHKQKSFQILKEYAADQKVTLLYAAKDTTYNHANVLADLSAKENENN
ncbi:DUF488 domain-containing protein [Halobacillus sp. BBL2006]|uniref:DUF488 domain-containing protein n=1 Tax=Halobacillus sp. BBL2006 TaxID=1543706 RepID=UPI0005435DA5|nr:DUF488 family protein [Halobacillus sp. BBL2006]KHE69711.1 hypothetical protein LD39_12515 [Halobacillus sp. BBL2006]